MLDKVKPIITEVIYIITFLKIQKQKSRPFRSKSQREGGKWSFETKL